MTIKKIGTVKELEYAPLKGLVVDGKEILIVKTGTQFLRWGTRAPTGDANFPAGNPKVKPYSAPVMDRCSISGRGRL